MRNGWIFKNKNDFNVKIPQVSVKNQSKMKSLNNFKETRVCFLNVYSKFIFISYCPFYCLLLPKFSVISTACAACSQLLVFCTKLGKKINLLISNSCLKIHFECFILSVVFCHLSVTGDTFQSNLPEDLFKKIAN